jgi:ATP-dependent exoDNAse (exonuclease V) alpha subunit
MGGRRIPGTRAAISKQAATQLQADSGITSGTLDSLLLHLDRPGAQVQAGSVVVVVGEAGMVPTRKLDELLGHCTPGVKVVLVGDHRQVPEIDAGGMLRTIAERHTIATLHDHRRQHDPDERIALADLRHGDVNVGLDWTSPPGVSPHSTTPPRHEPR